MDTIAVTFVIFAAVALGIVLVVGLAALLHIRQGRRERLQMKQHLRNI